MRLRRLLSAMLLSGVAACSRTGLSGQAGSPGIDAGAAIDMQAERRALLAADSALSRAASGGLGLALLPVADANLFFLQADQPLIRGRDGVERLFSASPESGSLRFSWHPIRVDVSSDGYLGYTWGYGTVTGAAPGDSATPAGYAIVWRKGAGGAWRVAAFLRNAARAALAAAPPGFESPDYRSYRPFPGSDRAAELRAIMRADSNFSAASAVQGLGGAFAAYAAPDGALLQGHFGPDAIGRSFAASPADMKAVWGPVGGDMAPSRDLGFTVGTAVFTYTSEGKPASAYTKYLSIWKRQPDGGWKYAFDGGNGSPAP